MEIYRKSEFDENGIPEAFLQDNVSVSRKDVLRGLHYQKEPYAQHKLIGVLSGRIFDVVVDLRPDQPSFGRWLGVTLCASTPQLLYVPAGFAHGFATLSRQAIVHYKTSMEYHPEADAGIAWNDPDLQIDWPVQKPILSAKDAALPCLKTVFPHLHESEASR